MGPPGNRAGLPMFDPALCLDTIARHRVTIFLPVPTMLAATPVQNAVPAANAPTHGITVTGEQLNVITNTAQGFLAAGMAPAAGGGTTTTASATARSR